MSSESALAGAGPWRRLRQLSWSLGRGWHEVRAVGVLLHHVRFNCLVAAASLAIAFNSQAQEAFRATVDDQRIGQIFVFNLLVLLLAASAWFTSRAMLLFEFGRAGVRDPTRARSGAHADRLRVLIPRCLGFSVPVLIALGLWTARLPRPAVALVTIAVVAWFAFRWLRMEVLGQFRMAGLRPVRLGELPPLCRWLLVAGLLLNVVLLPLFTLFEQPLATALGAPNVVLLGLMAILFSGNAMAYWSNTYGFPMISVLLLAAVVFGTINDNHEVRRLKDAGDPPPLADPMAHMESWLAVNDPCEGASRDCARPVFVVSAAGGGIRAAYWTAVVLDTLRAEYGSRFTDHLYAISGVSGGSLGAVVYAADEAQEGGASGTRVRRALAADFLAPTVATMLFPDLLQRFLPLAMFDDRALTLERSWERAWRLAAPGSDTLAQPFERLWRGERIPPVLLLNATLVETGQRVIVSPYGGAPGSFARAFPGAVPARELLGDAGVAASTAALLSARFTYVSPPGTVRAEPRGSGSLRLVDGGYFENHGITTARDVLRAMELAAATSGRAIRPVLIHIDNAPDVLGRDRSVWAAARTPWLPEVASPVRALLATRESRGETARAAAKEDPGLRVVEFRLFNELNGDVAEVPLGWMLSESSRRFMDDHFAASAPTCSEAVTTESYNGCQLARLGEIIDRARICANCDSL